ncbi:MAG: 50S ribosomal protein L29 [Deltaproteobacteria bacterium GWA2_38_16]|nr:MAG: 50S ribosomal protein L29 [Deltaproteobacteria bacterium GWA2_38_16]OGQ03791.1 MAG: 50S ribosomal protein L29 [Deltaproteobacteria bacterium RIFCSPHIGHO2_02_FULL_38_15]OGQ34315.1 MAG: 50S ribosomal protein L29 [Deltaproteobacteria bacterium RIFCSPLOWO2_01_FULL_38_9]OGQ59139.1 MAG: 50S ribosomal protein L29 [Deltaproteobacteria bacterium RIFCSPLOWO2_12_FULL_38_8]HBQ20830.1 50S ribosomal protein L29 [Deltaproteobacteria bacterium]
MHAKDIRELSEKELQMKEGELTQELFNLKFQFHSGQLEHASKIKGTKKDLARIKTILREKKGVAQP